MAKILKSELFAKIPSIDDKKIHAELVAALRNFPKKIVVLDDDPTGVQNVNGISVYTDWTAESIYVLYPDEFPRLFRRENSR